MCLFPHLLQTQESCDMLIHTKFQSSPLSLSPQLNDIMCQHLPYWEEKVLRQDFALLTLIKITETTIQRVNKLNLPFSAIHHLPCQYPL